MQVSQETKPRWERRKDARPQELLAAALNQFVERGYAGTRLEDVAKSAGVSKGTLYLYFANKEELFKAVVRETSSTRSAKRSWKRPSTTAPAVRCCVPSCLNGGTRSAPRRWPGSPS